jgi:hypothetical protein
MGKEQVLGRTNRPLSFDTGTAHKSTPLTIVFTACKFIAAVTFFQAVA